MRSTFFKTAKSQAEPHGTTSTGPSPTLAELMRFEKREVREREKIKKKRRKYYRRAIMDSFPPVTDNCHHESRTQPMSSFLNVNNVTLKPKKPFRKPERILSTFVILRK